MQRNLMTPNLYKKILKWINDDEIVKFYHTRQWRTIRKARIQHDNYECQACKDLGKVKPADTVHHIVHVKDQPLRALDFSNLESVCKQCHNRLHPEKFGDIQRKFMTEERW